MEFLGRDCGIDEECFELLHFEASAIELFVGLYRLLSLIRTDDGLINSDLGFGTCDRRSKHVACIVRSKLLLSTRSPHHAKVWASSCHAPLGYPVHCRFPHLRERSLYLFDGLSPISHSLRPPSLTSPSVTSPPSPLTCSFSTCISIHSERALLPSASLTSSRVSP